MNHKPDKEESCGRMLHTVTFFRIPSPMGCVTYRGIGIVFVVLVVVACAVVGVWGEELQSYWTSKDKPGLERTPVRTRHRMGSRSSGRGKHGHGRTRTKTPQHEEEKIGTCARVWQGMRKGLRRARFFLLIGLDNYVFKVIIIFGSTCIGV